MDVKLLTESGWKAVAAKFKIKDNGLQRALATYEKLDDQAHDECLKTIATVSQLANALKKAKEVAAAAPAAKYLDDLARAAESEKNEVTKAKAAALKQASADKAAAAAKQREQAAAEDEDEEQGDYKTKLLNAFAKVKSAKDQVYQFVICDTKPHCGLMIAKRISPQHKEELTRVTGGGKKFLKPGTVEFADGHFVFAMDQPVPGLARKLQDSIKNFTGKRLPITLGAESVDEQEQPPATPAAAPKPAAAPAPPGAPRPSPAAGATSSAPASASGFAISASVGQGGKNRPTDVEAVQKALNAKAKAGLVVDGKCSAQTIAAIRAFQQTLGKFTPDGLIEVGRGTARALAGNATPRPAPAPPRPVAPPKLGTGTLEKAPAVWHSTRNIVQTNLGELKRAVRSEYSSEHPKLLKDIEQNLVKLDRILDTLDTKLADSLAKAHAAKDEAVKKAELKNSKAIVAGYISYVKSEPLIAHVDSNPFGVNTNLKKVLTDSLLHMAQAIGT